MGPFLNWTKEELKKMDQRIRKLMTMHRALHFGDDTGSLYVSRKEGGNLVSIQDSVNTSMKSVKDYIKNLEEYWLQRLETI